MALLAENQVYLKQTFTDKENVFQFLATETVKKGIATNKQAVFDSLISREAESTTGMMDGFAIPHAKDDAIQNPAILIMSMPNPIDWASLDGQPTDFIIALFIPTENQGNDYLKILSQVAKMLMHDDIKKALKESNSPKDIIETLEKNIQL